MFHSCRHVAAGAKDDSVAVLGSYFIGALSHPAVAVKAGSNDPLRIHTGDEALLRYCLPWGSGLPLHGLNRAGCVDAELYCLYPNDQKLGHFVSNSVACWTRLSGNSNRDACCERLLVISGAMLTSQRHLCLNKLVHDAPPARPSQRYRAAEEREPRPHVGRGGGRRGRFQVHATDILVIGPRGLLRGRSSCACSRSLGLPCAASSDRQGSSNPAPHAPSLLAPLAIPRFSFLMFENETVFA